MKIFDINTVTILRKTSTNDNLYLVKGKLIGGKRWKRGYIRLNKDDIRNLKIRNIGL